MTSFWLVLAGTWPQLSWGTLPYWLAGFIWSWIWPFMLLKFYWLHWVYVVPALVRLYSHICYTGLRIPALAFVVFTYLLHWANGIPALAPPYKLTYLHIGYTGLTWSQLWHYSIIVAFHGSQVKWLHDFYSFDSCISGCFDAALFNTIWPDFWFYFIYFPFLWDWNVGILIPPGTYLDVCWLASISLFDTTHFGWWNSLTGCCWSCVCIVSTFSVLRILLVSVSPSLPKEVLWPCCAFSLYLVIVPKALEKKNAYRSPVQWAIVHSGSFFGFADWRAHRPGPTQAAWSKKKMPSTRLLSLVYHQLQRKQWHWVPWKYRLTVAKSDERQAKMPKIRAGQFAYIVGWWPPFNGYQ